MRLSSVLLILCLSFTFSSVFATGHGCHAAHASHAAHTFHGRAGHRAPAPPPVPYDGRWMHFGGKFSLNAEPFRALDPLGATIPLGFEFFLTKDVSISGTAATPLYYIPYGNGKKGEEDHAHIFEDQRYDAQLRWYLHNENEGRFFVGGEVSYRRQTEGIDSGGYVQDDKEYSYGHATVTKESTGAAVILGWTEHLYKGLSLEVFAGVGARVHTTWQENIVRLHDDGPDNCSCKKRPDNNIIGQHTSYYLPFGARLVWTFGKMPVL